MRRIEELGALPDDNTWSETRAAERRAELAAQRKADPALLILGLAVVDNRAMAELGDLSDEARDEALRNLRPTHVAQWVVDAALARPDAPTLGQYDLFLRVLPDADPQASDWNENREAWLAEIVRLRGPGATRFPPKTSGNPRGRPHVWREEFPYDHGFLIEPVMVRIHGRERTMPRLDALLCQLWLKALKDEQKLLNVLLPVVMKYHEKWIRHPIESFEIVREPGY